MAIATERLRNAIVAFHVERAAADLAWWRRGELDFAWQSAADRLSGERGDELLGDALSAGELSPDEQAGVVRQRAVIAAQASALRIRPILQRLLATRIPCGSEALVPAALLNALMQSSDPASGALRARVLGEALSHDASQLCELRGVVDDTLTASGIELARCAAARETAHAFLAATDDAARELVPWLVRTTAPRASAALHQLIFALRRHELDSFAKPGRRFHRLAEGLRRLGFERDLNARVHVESAASALLVTTPRLAPRGVPSDVRLVTPANNLGVLADFDGAAAVGCGLALSLVSPALPPELRFPTGHATPEGVGGLLQRVRAERLYLRRLEGLAARDAETLARHNALLLLLATRVSAALELIAVAPARDGAERREMFLVAATRALATDLPAGVATLLWSVLPPLCVDLRGKLAGAALHVALREHFDEDWFENPRAAEPLRGICSRGNTLDVESACAELGTSLNAAASSMLEILT